jgi:hypothetical protein
MLLLVLIKFSTTVATDSGSNQKDARLSDGFSALKKSIIQHRKPNIGT